MTAEAQAPPALSPSGIIPWRLVISFFLFLTFTFVIFSTGRVHTIDEVSAVYQTESLALRGSTAVPQAVVAKWFYGELDRFGQPQTPYPPGQPVASIPWFVVGHFAAKHLPGVPVDSRDLVGDLFFTASSAAYSALAATLALVIFLRMKISVGASLAAAGMLALASPLAAYSAWFFSEPLATVFLVGAAAALFTGDADIPVSKGRAALAGILLGAAIWVRPTHVLAAAVFLIALYVRDRKSSFTAVAVLSAIVGFAGAAFLWRNSYLFGSFFNFGYPPAAEGGKALNTFNTPFFTGLFGYLFSPGKSIFIFAPAVLLAIFGWRSLWRKNRGLATVALLTPIVYILFFATYTQWEGGYCYGPRYLLPALTLLGLALGPALADAGRWVRVSAIALFVAGFAVQAIGITTSFLEAAVGKYYDATFNYNMAFAPVWRQTRFLWYYAKSPIPAPMGRGFDRWWLLLGKAGVSHGTLWTIGLLEFACAAISGFVLWQSWRNRERTVEIPAQSATAD
jgi:hypothetical protein